MQKRPPKSSKNEMFVFGLRSNSDDQRSNPSNESQPTNSEWPISHDSQLLQSFLIEVAQNGQFHMIYNISNLFSLKWLRMTRNTASMVPNLKPPLPPQNETANRVPNSKPPSLPKMKLPIGCPI